MATEESHHSLTLTRRRFVQGVAAAGIAAAVEGKFNHANAEIIGQTATFARSAGESIHVSSLVFGVWIWR